MSTGKMGKPIAAFVLALFTVLPLCGPLACAQEESVKRVLVLNSYNKGFVQTDNIVKGIESILRAEENDIELRIEYMDSKATEYETRYKEKLYDLYKYKYGDQTFDLIISSDDNAFNFLREYQQDLFPGTPIVFCGVNNLEAPNLVDRDVFTGIIELQSIKETIDIALKLHPGTRQIVFVVDNTPTGVYMWGQIQELFKYYKDIQMSRIDDSLSMEQIEDKVSKLSDDTIVLFGPLHRDKSGKYYSFEEAASRISKASVRPMYGYSVQVLPYGIVGGKLFGGFYHGQVTAEMAQRILMGEKVRDIPVLTEPQTQYMFDYEQMQRWGIKVSDLPEGSIVVNKPHSFYEENKELIWGIIAVMTLQTLTIIGLLVNVSRRKLVEARLKRTVVDLERSNADLEHFAYVASHDLQEPLRMVSSYVQLLARRYEGQLDADADEFIGYAVGGANRMHRLLNDLLTYSRLDTRGKPFEPTGCEAALDRALAKLQVVIEESGAVVTRDSLPTVMADDSQLLQLFQNLIDNAVKFRSKEPPRIHISAKRLPLSQAGKGRDGGGSEWVFSVRDNGIGIDPQFFERIFIIFQRLHGWGDYPGTGMGLAVCKRIVERHGGRLWVESEPGEGTTFFFTMRSET